jgi:hypothetical protein
MTTATAEAAWLAPHRSSEELAVRAASVLVRGRSDAAALLFAEAAEYETAALKALDSGKPRTLGILSVSAASLWLKAGRPDKVVPIASEAIRSELLPAFAEEALADILSTIRLDA